MTTAGEALGEEAARKLMSSQSDFTIHPGLNGAELKAVEEEHGFTLADDHRAFLRRIVPAGPGWPDWRAPGGPALVKQLAWPVDGVLFDVEQNGVWFEALWGPRPAAMAAALAEAARFLSEAPQMVPIFAHRYLPPGEGTFGHPVLSMYQTDIIRYAADLADYIDVECGGGGGGRPFRDYPDCTVPFWGDLVS